jgi:F-type H+-transporting ATPase subunit delta
VAEQAQISGIAERYALAVFELAQEQKVVETVGRDLATLKALIAQSADLARLVHAPIFTRREQQKGMDAILVKMGADPLTARFVLLLAAKRRLYLLPDAIRAFEKLLAKQLGQVDAEVASARALSDAECAALKAALKSKLGRDPQLHTSVDPALLGGLVVKVGSRMIDSSLRTKLNGIRLAMKGH